MERYFYDLSFLWRKRIQLQRTERGKSRYGLRKEPHFASRRWRSHLEMRMKALKRRYASAELGISEAKAVVEKK